jgi:MATE family, multidrug efflux pump
VVALGAGLVIDLYRLDPKVARYVRQFLTVYGGCSFFMAINIGQASILRSWGHARDPMLVNGLCLVLTVAGNALCLFGPFGFPVLGVTGVAASTVASQAIACGLSAWMIRRRGGLELRLREAMPGRPRPRRPSRGRVGGPARDRRGPVRPGPDPFTGARG